MGSFGAPLNFGSSGFHSIAQASDKDTQLPGSSPGKRSKGQHSSTSGATGRVQQHPAESWSRSNIHDQQFIAGQGSTSAPTQQPGVITSAFAELDSNQDPLQRARFTAASGKDSSSMGDQAKQQPSAPVFGGFPAPEANASWASLMSGISQNYSSPGAKAAGRRAGTRKGATLKASRMQQRSAAAPAATGPTSATLGQGNGTAAFGSPAGPMFAFGSPMPPTDRAAAGAAAGTAGAAGPAQAAGPTPVPSTLPPGTAMSTDTAPGATFTAAFSAMSIDATPAAFGSSAAQEPWAFRGARAASLTGKRLFDTPSSAGADSSSPNPFASWGAASGADGSAGRAGADPVPFPGFGGAAQDGATGSSSPSFAFNPGKASPGPGRGRGRQHRSPAQKPPAAASFGGFSSPAFAPKPPPAAATGGTSNTPAPAPFAAGGGLQAGSSSATPSMASGGSFQGFFGGAKPPGSAASTPGFSPMMWSPVDNQAQAPAPAAAAAGGAVPAGVPAAGLQPQAHAPTAADTMAAAAMDLPSDDSTEATITQLSSQPSASGSRPAAAAAAQPAEAPAIVGLRQAVEQLSTSEQPPAQQQQQQQQAQHAAQPAEQPAVPSFVFGSPEPVAAMGRSDSTWLSSPGDVGPLPTTLFDMSPLKTALDGNSTGQQAAVAASAAGSAAPQPAFAAAVAAAPSAFTVGGTAGAAGIAAGAAGRSAGAGAGAVPSFSAGSFSPVSGKGSKAAAGGSGKHAAQGKKATPAKPQRHAGAAAAAAGAAASSAPQASFGFPAAGSGSSAASAAGQPNGLFRQPQQQQQQQQYQQEQQSGEGVSYRRHPTSWGDTGNRSDTSSTDHADTFLVQQQQVHQAAADSRTPGRRKLHATPRRAQRLDGAQQPGAQQQQRQQPAASIQQPWQAPAANPAPNMSFTVGSSKGAAAGPSAKSPRKARAASQQQQQQQQQQQNGAAQQAAAVDEAVRQAKVWEQRAQMSHANHSWLQADGELAQGIAILQNFQEHPKAADGLCWLLAARASARIGADDPEAALTFGLQAIKVRPKSIEARLRAATCLCKLGCLAAADRLLDKAMDMLSAGHQDWARLRKKKQQAHQLEQQQQRVVAAALGCDPAAAAAALAALSAGLPVQQHLEGAGSISPRPTSAAAVAALVDAGTDPLQDAAAAQELIEAADKLTSELAFWEDSTALKAWLQLRSGQLAAAAQTAESQPNKYLAKKPHHSSSEWGWRWWVLAQVKWQQGDMAAAKALLQQGQGMLQKALQGSSDSSSSTCLWLLLLPSLAELSELLQQVQQLLVLKEAGNAAIQAKQYEKAAEEYTKALALQPSCGFAAVIHSNRAAALQQQQRLIEALADCSRAVALDPKYARAYLRMAQVLEALHRADRAVVVLQDALKGAANAVDPATTRGHELTHGAAVLQLSSTDRRKFEDMLATAQVAARRFKTPHHYKALGLAMGATEADIKKAYRGLALKHHPDKALQHCRWSAKLGRCGAAAAHVTAPSGGVEASLKAAANEVFGFLSAAQEELTSATSRSKLDRDLRTEEQLYSNSGGSSYSRPASYTYSYGGRRADADYGFDDFFRRTAAAGGGSRPAQPAGRQQGSGSGSSRAAGSSGGASRPAGATGGQRWYENSYWESAEADVESEEDDDYDYGYGGTGFHYRSRY